MPQRELECTIRLQYLGVRGLSPNVFVDGVTSPNGVESHQVVLLPWVGLHASSSAAERLPYKELVQGSSPCLRTQ